MPDIGSLDACDAFNEWHFPAFVPGVNPVGSKKAAELVEWHINVNGICTVAHTFGLPCLTSSTPSHQTQNNSQGKLMFNSFYLFFSFR